MNIGNNIMVCVTQQRTCERLIKKGDILNHKINADLYIIHVVKEGTNFLGNDKDSDAIEYLYEIARESGAEMTVVRSNDIVGTLASFTKQKGIGHVVMGEAPSSTQDTSINRILQEKLPNIDFYIVPAKELE